QSLVGTASHPVRTRRGWVPLGALTLADDVRVLVGRAPRPLPASDGRADLPPWSVALARLLGLLAAGGRLAHAFPEQGAAQSVVVASRDPAALDAVEVLARAHFASLTPHRRQRGR